MFTVIQPNKNQIVATAWIGSQSSLVKSLNESIRELGMISVYREVKYCHTLDSTLLGEHLYSLLKMDLFDVVRLIHTSFQSDRQITKVAQDDYNYEQFDHEKLDYAQIQCVHFSCPRTAAEFLRRLN